MHPSERRRRNRMAQKGQRQAEEVKALFEGLQYKPRTLQETMEADASRTADGLSRGGDVRIMRGSEHTRTRTAHQFCPHGKQADGHHTGCGFIQFHGPSHQFCDAHGSVHGETQCDGNPTHKHVGHAIGCGTHAQGKCGGRYKARNLPLAQFVKSDATTRIALGNKRAQRIRERGW